MRTVPLGLHQHGAYLATPKGARAVGGGLGAPRARAPAGPRHALVVADVADRLLAPPKGYQGGAPAWRTERELARDGAAAWPYRPDGLLVLTAPDGAEHRMAVEVELGAKPPRRYAPKVAWYRARLADGTLQRVRWYCAGLGTLRAVQRATAGIAGIEVVPLPN